MKQTRWSQTRIGIATFLVFSLFVCGFASIPQAQASTVTQTRFFSGRSLNVYKNGNIPSLLWKSMYQAKVGVTGLTTYKVYADLYGNLTLYTGIRVYTRNANGTETQLTSAVSATVSLNGLATDYASFYQLNGYWTPNNKTMQKTDILVIYAYSSTDNATWALMTETSFYSQWNTESLLATKLISSTWNVTYEISYFWDYAAETWHTFGCWATGYTADQQPRISNIQLDNGETTPTDENMEQYFLLGGSMTFLIGFAVAITRRKRLMHE